MQYAQGSLDTGVTSLTEPLLALHNKKQVIVPTGAVPPVCLRLFT